MKKIIIYLFTVLFISHGYSQNSKWLTHYEKSEFKETPRYKETIEYSKMLAENSKWIEYKTFGKSAQGRDLPVLIVDKKQNFNPEKVKKSGNAIFLIEACIHPGEPEGKDAGLMLIRDLVIHEKTPEILNNVTILFIPIFNADGHERFGPYNRINQNGPEEMGWRTTAQNLNLNRDFLKADSPEMAAWLKFYNTWMPDFFADIHTTDGADYQYVMTYAMETYGNMEAGLTKWQEEIYLETIVPRMNQSGNPVFRYVSFRQWHNPRSGLVAWAAEPRLSQGYTAIRNRPGLLIETHMLKDYKTRVEGTYKMLEYTLEILNKESENLQEIIKKADEFTASDEFINQKFPVEFAPTGDSTIVNFKGIEYKAVKSNLTGADWFQYGDDPETFKIDYFNDIQPVNKVSLPEFYIIPPEWHEVISRIKLHSIITKKLAKETKIEVDSYKFHEVKWNSTPYEGRQRIQQMNIDPITELRTFPKGSVVINMNQPTARVIAHILEPAAPDSYLKWGFFNAIFEQKEYGEMYVMEKKAREMLKNDKELRKAFEKKKKNDPEFANNPWAISNWFYQKTPYWDEQKNIYPVGKIVSKKSIEAIKKSITE